jgi:hypothetical protein
MDGLLRLNDSRVRPSETAGAVLLLGFLVGGALFKGKPGDR